MKKFYVGYAIFYFSFLAIFIFMINKFIDDEPCSAYNINKLSGYFNTFGNRNVVKKIPIYCEHRSAELQYIGTPGEGGHWVEKN